MKCKKCNSGKVEDSAPIKTNLCPRCFVEHYIARVKKTVEEFKMFSEKNRVGVAVSGGKDSAALLHVLKKAYPNTKFIALHINLGIPEYSEHCQEKVEALTDLLGIELFVYDLEKELGIKITDFEKTLFKKKICSVCGTIKRRLLEEMAVKAKVEVLATGHNLEDVLSVMFNNFLHGRWDQLVRLKPVLPPLTEEMALKIKPLLRISENENLYYCLCEKIPFREKSCPFSIVLEQKSREIIETIAKYNPNFKYYLLNRFLEIARILESKHKPILTKCENCGFPSTNKICAFCKRISLVKSRNWDEI